jgi:hypothetical protein
MELDFYARYDESFLFSKAVTLMYAIEQGDAFKENVQQYADQWRIGSLKDKYFASLRAELFFMALHQFESFFALLIAPFQQVPTWIYLTAYTTDEMKRAVGQFLDRDIGALTNGAYQFGEVTAFLEEALYGGSMSTDPDQQLKWGENLDNATWLIRRAAQAYLDNLKAYNSYKHGLRTMTGSNAHFTIRLNDAEGKPTGSGFTRTSEDSLSYLDLQPNDLGTGCVREVL